MPAALPTKNVITLQPQFKVVLPYSSPNDSVVQRAPATETSPKSIPPNSPRKPWTQSDAASGVRCNDGVTRRAPTPNLYTASVPTAAWGTTFAHHRRPGPRSRQASKADRSKLCRHRRSRCSKPLMLPARSLAEPPAPATTSPPARLDLLDTRHERCGVARGGRLR